MTIEPCNLGKLPFKKEDNPLFKTVLEIIDNDDICWKDTSFYNHHVSFKPKTLADIYGMKPGSPLDNLSPYTIFLPWYHFKPVVKYKDTSTFIPDKDVLFKNKAVSKKLIIEKIDKLKKLIESFKLNGYNSDLCNDRKGGNIRCFILKGDKKESAYIVSGNHRSSTFLALFPNKQLNISLEEYYYLKPIELAQCGCIVRTEDDDKMLINIFQSKTAKSWPSVKSNFLTESQAIEMFNSYMGE